MAILLLVRHATTAATGQRLGGWTPGVHLDDAGRAQARATAARLADLDVATVVSSPLERTRDTAEIIAAEVGRDVQLRDGLGETDYGEWTNRPLAELRDEPLWRVVQSTPSRVTFPAGESLRGTQRRIVDELERLADDHDDGDVVVAVSHADPIKAALAHFLGMPLDTFQRLVVTPASVSVVALFDGRPPAVPAVNVTGKLDLPAPSGGDDAGPDSADDTDGGST